MMNRRNFIKNFSLIGFGLAGSAALRALAEDIPELEDFNLKIITDDSERAVTLLEAILARSLSVYKNLKFSECPLAGQHVADLVLIKNRRLIDYRNAIDELAAGLREVARSLGLPKKVENPVLMKFYTEDPRRAPKTIDIFGNNILLKRLSLTEDEGAHQITSERGGVTLVIRNKSAKITAATCQHQTCVKMGAINAAGQSLICLPNQLRISIEGQAGSGLDGITF
jgi:hypothetical protein